ncbi:lytic transglycosylase domain-containing protein [Aeromicrobium sp. CF4.19]|uniref:lytic transglycosylase domain-containing protein n=1 Tax=Aeromicrobium sp. CF4.19 TaxID=3373082 RepID=UPI003EE49FA3
MSAPRRSLAVVAVALMVLGLGFIAVAGWQLSPAAEQAVAEPPAAAPPAAAPETGDEQAAPGDAAISALADPEWVARVGQSTGIGERALAAYAGASLQLSEEQPGCGLGWNTLAAIGQVESEHGTIDGAVLDEAGRATPEVIGIALDGTQGTARIADTDEGGLDGDPLWDRAVGPMQFIPSTWAQHAADGDGDGVENPQSVDDAVLAAARYLCADSTDLREPQAWVAAVRSYNDSADYTAQVARVATAWSATP